jgi:hypothetical protein
VIFILFFGVNFVMLLKWQSYINIYLVKFGDIQNMKLKNLKYGAFHVVGNCDKFWRFFCKENENL